MRVIAGSAKKRRLKTPGDMTVRPTADRVKEALYNILGDRVPQSSFLDLYAGTGNIGIEALSRGAASAVFVEQEHQNTRLIVENLKITGFLGRARIIRRPVKEGLKLLGAEGLRFDLIFLDPPYRNEDIEEALAGIVNESVLNAGGIVVVECGAKRDLPDDQAGLKMVRQEKYGDTMLTFFRTL